MREDPLASICDVRRRHARNLLAAADGNVSAPLGAGRIAISPSGVAKAGLGALREARRLGGRRQL